MIRECPKPFTGETESEFLRHLHNVYTAAQDIAFSFGSDPTLSTPCATFASAHTAFVRTLPETDADPFSRRRLLAGKHHFLIIFLSWVEALLPETAAQLQSACDSASALSESQPRLAELLAGLRFDVAAIGDYASAEGKSHALESDFRRASDALGSDFVPLETLRDLSRRQIACIRALQAANALEAFVRSMPEAPGGKARELEQWKAVVAEKQKELAERKAELAKTQNEERELDRQIAQKRAESKSCQAEIANERRRRQERIADLKQQIEDELATIQRIRDVHQNGAQ
jgi:hypothetical protein